MLYVKTPYLYHLEICNFLMMVRKRFKIYHVSSRFGLEQACTTCGPRAKCGPQKLLVWPAKPQILFILFLFLLKTPCECVKTYQLWPLDKSKKLLAHHEI